MLATPHTLVEASSSRPTPSGPRTRSSTCAARSSPVLRRVQNAVAEAYAAGYLGRDILGSGFDLDVVVHAGAGGAYICGEETALLDSLEGRRGQPRLRPPFPAVAGLYACPTVVNNVESIASVPAIVLNGVDWFHTMGTEKSPGGFTLYSLSGHVTRPGQYEAPLGITLRELLDYAGGGIRAGHRLKFWTPGGSSTPLFTAEQLDVPPLDYEGVGPPGRCSAPRPCRSSTRPRAWCARSCAGRSSTNTNRAESARPVGRHVVLVQILERLEAGTGTEDDLDKLLDISDNILGRAFCALGDAATSPITSSIALFRDEYIAHLSHGGCPFDPRLSSLTAGGPS